MRTIFIRLQLEKISIIFDLIITLKNRISITYSNYNINGKKYFLVKWPKEIKISKNKKMFTVPLLCL